MGATIARLICQMRLYLTNQHFGVLIGEADDPSNSYTHLAWAVMVLGFLKLKSNVLHESFRIAITWCLGAAGQIVKVLGSEISCSSTTTSAGGGDLIFVDAVIVVSIEVMEMK